MNTRLLSIASLASLALFGAGCWGSTQVTTAPPVSNPVPTPPSAATTSQVTTPPPSVNPKNVLVSTVDSTKYCNGADMDSEGYRKTITKTKSVSFSANESQAQHVKAVIVASTTGQCQQALKQLDITVSNGTVHIPTIDAWAGISIAMCACKPQVEVNALRVPGITNVVWE